MPARLKPCGKICIYDSVERKNYCDAWKACTNIGGRLPLEDDLSNLKTCVPDQTYFVGLTDLYVEKNTSKSRWIFSNEETISDVNL